MKIKSIKISGFKGIPFCAIFSEETMRIDWSEEQFSINFPTEQPLISAIIGPNSCGKSSVFYAIEYFLSASRKPSTVELFYMKDVNRPILIEVTMRGEVNEPNEWVQNNCNNIDGCYELTLASITTKEKIDKYIIQMDGVLRKLNINDKSEITKHEPKFRLITGDSKLSDEINPEKKNLVTDLIDDIIKIDEKTSERSVLKKIQKNILELEKLVDRENNGSSKGWKDILLFEKEISSGFSALIPGEPQVRFDVKDNLPSVQNIFHKGKFSIIDGVELSFNGHGLGIQRTFLMSILSAWTNKFCKANEEIDYFFAIEEPELYLHPHAIRVLISIILIISKAHQIVFSTHTGEFVNTVPFENVIKIHRSIDNRKVMQPDIGMLNQEKYTKVQRYLRENRSDMLFARSVLLVEGQAEYFAFPGFAHTLGLELDKKGVSIVFTGSKDNFEVYHHILSAFGIPHVILVDGDGDKPNRVHQYSQFADGCFVLEFDFEYSIADNISQNRLLTIINKCRTLSGKAHLENLQETGITATQLKKGWWEHLKDDVRADIQPEYRSRYQTQMDQIQSILSKIARDVKENNHLLPDAKIKKQSDVLKKQTKPLAGRVVGEQLTKKEIMKLPEISGAIFLVFELSN